jgi:hypothetical protein
LQFVERKLQLPERYLGSLGGTTKAPAFEARDLCLEFFDQLVASDEQTLQRFDIIGQLLAGQCHTRSVRHARFLVCAFAPRILRCALRLPGAARPAPVDALEQHR